MKRTPQVQCPARCMLAFSLLVAGVQAAELSNQQPELLPRVQDLTNQLQDNPEVPSLGLVAHATKMLGQKVKDQDEHTVGQLRDILIELPGGEVHAGIIQSGRKNFAVPARAFFPAGDTRIIFNANEKLFNDAPEFKPESRPLVLKNSLVESYKHFGHRPPDAATGSQELHAVSSIIGNNVRTGGEIVGRLKEIVVELSQGRTIYFILSPTADAAHANVPVPPQLFQASGEENALKFSGTAEQLLNAPRIPAQFPTQAAMPEFAASVYKHYGVQFTGPTERTSALGETQAHPPLTPTGRTDAEIRQAFLRAITQDDAMPAAAAKDLNIHVQSGRMTLSGSVRTEAQKRALISAAQQAAGANNIIDNVIVR